MAATNSGSPVSWRIALFGALGFYWLSLWDALRIDWATNSQYGFGWSVPLIAIGFFLQRWPTRPAPSSIPGSQRLALYVLLAAFAWLQLPLRLIEEANAEWRILFWCREIQCSILTLGVIALAGGWRWVRHFSFPVLFTATAVPWSKWIETPLTQKMMRLVTTISVEGLFLLKIPALQKGNLIHLADGVVGVGEACSGMRSLQASLMLALVGGELWNLSAPRRWLIVFLGICSAFVLNTTRALSLAVIAETRGFAAMKLWHDWCGMIEMGACIAVVFVMAWRLRPNDKLSSGAIANDAIPAGPEPGAGRRIGLGLFRLSLGLTGIWFAAEIAAQAWYKIHDLRIEPQWTLAAPAPETPGFAQLQLLEISDEERAQLRTNDCLSFKWRQDSGLSWSLSFLRWPVGRSSEACVTAHRPDLCLPAAGYGFICENDPVEIVVNAIPMLFHHYLFRENDKSVHVFYMLSDLKTAGFKALECDLSIRGRLKAAMSGRKNNRRAILELLVTGAGAGTDVIHPLSEALGKTVSVLSVPQNHL